MIQMHDSNHSDIKNLARYFLESELNGKIIDEKKGASGVVYIVDNGENCSPRKVAYKTFQERFQLDEEKKSHFLTECSKWFSLTNYYIVTPFYARVIRGQPFICMPFCNTDLKTLMENKIFSRVEALVIITQLVKSLCSFELKGFRQHQDLNPPNIMLIDICNNFPDYPSRNLINYEVKIADFGMLDLYNSLGLSKGAIGGKYPFKAPEQYSFEDRKGFNKNHLRTEDFKPDTFALGVIIYMLLIGSHPNGMTIQKALNKNTSSSKFKTWALSSPKVGMADIFFEPIINGCLNSEPLKRPLLSDILILCLQELEKEDYNTFSNLKLRFEQKDNLNSFFPRINHLHILSKIASLPGQRTDVLKNLLLNFEEQKSQIFTPFDVVYYGKTLQLILSLVRKQDMLEDFLTKELFGLIDSILKWSDKLKVEHLFPSKNENGVNVLPAIKFLRDLEVSSQFTSVAFTALQNFVGNQVIKKWVFTKNNQLLFSLYYYNLATDMRNIDIFKTVSFLDQAKKHHKAEPLFDFMKSLWISHSLLFQSFSPNQKRHLLLEQEKAKKAIKTIAPEWMASVSNFIK